MKYWQYFFVLVLVWPVLLPAGIDTGIGNAFLSPIIFNTFQQYFFKNSNITNEQLQQNIEERRCSKTVQHHLHLNQTRIRLRLLQPLLHQSILARITSKRNATIARPDADAEMESYLSDPSTELSSLEAYPNIRQVYLKLNTGLPASAAVERLFSLGGRVLSSSLRFVQ